MISDYLQLLSPLISVFFGLGFYFIGSFLINILNFGSVINKISDPHYQYASISICFFLLIFYPITLYGLLNTQYIVIISIIFLLTGFIFFLFSLKKIIIFTKKILKFKSFSSFSIFLVYSLLFGFFLLTLSPITGADALGYHLPVSQKLLNTGSYPVEIYDLDASKAGSGEVLFAFALSVNAFQFTNISQFIGLYSIYGILKRFCHLSLNENQKKHILLIFLSCPFLVFLLSASKPQLIFVSFTTIAISILLSISKKNSFKEILLLTIILCCSYFSKIHFVISSSLIGLASFFIFFKRYFALNKSIYLLIVIVSTTLPIFYWRHLNLKIIFPDFLIYNFPKHLDSYIEYYSHIKNYIIHKFPFIFFIPLSPSDLSITFGLSFFVLITPFFLIKKRFFDNLLLFLILAFIIISLIFSMKDPRFFLEPFLWSLILLIKNFKYFKYQKIIKVFNKYILIQSCIVLFIISYALIALLIPSLVSKKSFYETLIKNADGFSLFEWSNSIVPSNSVLISTHRSIFFSEPETIKIEALQYCKQDCELYFQEIKRKRPEFILFYGVNKNLIYGQFNLSKCVSDLYSFKNTVGTASARNPFARNNNYYNGYIYKIIESDFSKCAIKII
jgi:hypothetical protein